MSTIPRTNSDDDEQFSTMEFIYEARRPLLIERHRKLIDEMESGLSDQLVTGEADNPRLVSMLKQLEEDGEEANEDLLTSIEDDDELDRFLQVSPLVEPGAVKQAGVVVDQVLLLAGKMVGYLPVPELVVGEEQLVPAAVVDLNYRATIDRFSQVTRVTSISEVARTQLRYVLARTDALRTPTMEFELSSIIGKTITKARVSKRNPLTIELILNDESKITLMQVPGSPPSGGPARTSRSANSGQQTPQ